MNRLAEILDKQLGEMAYMLTYTLLAGIGGLLGCYTRTPDRRKVPASRIVVNSLSSAFVGSLIIMLLRAYNVDESLYGPISGFAGWLGADTSIRLLERYLYKKLQISPIQYDDTDAEK